MDTHDWALILFTLLLQSAVGIFVVSRTLLWRQSESPLRRRYLWLVGGLGILAVLASFFHLGSPTNAFLTMSNLGKSWLSREILFTVLFGAGWLVSLVLEGRAVGTPGGRNLAHGVTGLIGIGAIFVMSMVYRSSVIPAWKDISVTLGFYATAGLIGCAAVFAGQLWSARKDEAAGGLNPLFIGAMVMVALQGIALSLQLAHMGGVGPEGQASASLLTKHWLTALWLRIGLTTLGAGALMALATWRTAMGRHAGTLLPIGGLLVATVSLGELLGRVIFFATKVKIGL